MKGINFEKYVKYSMIYFHFLSCGDRATQGLFLNYFIENIVKHNKITKKIQIKVFFYDIDIYVMQHSNKCYFQNISE